MGTAKGVGRIIGVLLLVQFAAGVLVNFVLMWPLITVPPGFLVNAAANSLQVTCRVFSGSVRARFLPASRSRRFRFFVSTAKRWRSGSWRLLWSAFR